MNLQEETLLFYYELGTAITQWAQLELSLLLLLRSCFPSKQGAAVVRGYLSIDAFNRKLAFVSEVLTERPRFPKVEKQWKEVQARIRAASQTRNNLVHWIVHTYPAAPEGRRRVLIPWRRKGLRQPPDRSRPPSDALCVRKIRDARIQFFAAIVDIEDFQYQLKGRRSPFSLGGRTATRPSQLSDIRKEWSELAAGAGLKIDEPRKTT